VSKVLIAQGANIWPSTYTVECPGITAVDKTIDPVGISITISQSVFTGSLHMWVKDLGSWVSSHLASNLTAGELLFNFQSSVVPWSDGGSSIFMWDWPQGT
jgi:hypothetical protein